MLNRQILYTAVSCLMLIVACSGEKDRTGWQSLFNGRSLDGWTPKITGHEAGVNFGDTFVAEDGVLKVNYQGYQTFDDRFGHLFYEQPFDNYHLRFEYRFTGEQIPGGPGWAWRNSGVMIHCQAPETMLVEQDFPISLEAQLLGGNGEDPRTTMNLCTPGTEVDLGGTRVTDHCISSDSDTFHGDQWVAAEIIVTATEISHLVEGDTILRYANPRIGGGVVAGYDPQIKKDGQRLNGGYIALQSESHPVEFRSIRIRELR